MKILVTRPRKQSDSLAQALKEAGWEPILLPVIAIRPSSETVALERAIAKLNCYDWIIFTSVNGVESFLNDYTISPWLLPQWRDGTV